MHSRLLEKHSSLCFVQFGKTSIKCVGRRKQTFNPTPTDAISGTRVAVMPVSHQACRNRTEFQGYSKRPRKRYNGSQTSCNFSVSHLSSSHLVADHSQDAVLVARVLEVASSLIGSCLDAPLCLHYPFSSSSLASLNPLSRIHQPYILGLDIQPAQKAVLQRSDVRRWAASVRPGRRSSLGPRGSEGPMLSSPSQCRA